MRILPILGGIAAAVVFFFAVIFALAASYSLEVLEGALFYLTS